MMRWLRAVAMLLLMTCAAAAGAQDKAGKVNDYRLGPGDSIRVQVFQNPDLSIDTRVSETGVVNYPLVGRVRLGGLTVHDAEARIASALKRNRILKSPQVTIHVLEVRGSLVAVLGQVQRPGRFPLETTNVRVSDMLAAAGGIAQDGSDVLVVTGTRNRKPFRRTIDIPALFAARGSGEDIVLSAGDTIFVGKAPVYYIYGEAQRPGHYRLERGMTVQQALAQGGGLTPRGTQRGLRLTRTNADGKAVELTPQLSDPVRPNDVLYVRESLF